MSKVRFLPVLAAVMAACLLAFGPSAGAEPDDKGAKKAKPKGPLYSNKALGVRTHGPLGWTVVPNKVGAVSTWKLIATFNDKDTDAQVTLYSRPRASSSLDGLMASVRKEWNKSTGRLRLDGMRKVPRSAMNPVSKVIVDGSFSRKAKAKKSKDGVPAPPGDSTPMRVQATYYLGPGHEFLLYATTQATHWTRLRKGIQAMRDELGFDKQIEDGATGEGSYRNERLGFTCRFPKDYSVVQPQRAHHVVKFAGVDGSAPVLSIYAFPWAKEAGDDADRLVTYYTEDKAGEATRRSSEVSGSDAVLVSAKAMIDGQDRVYLIAVLKRGENCFRLRCSAPAEEEGKVTAAFRAFLRSFRFGL